MDRPGDELRELEDRLDESDDAGRVNILLDLAARNAGHDERRARRLAGRALAILGKLPNDEAVAMLLARPKYEAAKLETAVAEAQRTAEATGVRGEEKYRLLVERSPYCIHQIDLEGKLISMNPAGLYMLGLDDESEAVGVPYLSSVAEGDERERVSELLDAAIAGESSEFEFRTATDAIYQSCFVPILDAAGRTRRLMGLTLDLTERRRAEEERERLQEQLRESSRLEAVGRFAGEIVHDMNNVMTLLLGRTHLLGTELGDCIPPSVAKHIDEMDRTIDRATSMMKQLMAFSRQQELRPSVIHPNQVIRGVEAMLRELLPENIAFQHILAPRDPSVRADASQLEQVLVNLLLNARDAMPSGGSIVVETCEVSLSEEHTRTNPGARSGDHVLISVTDTGKGIDDATRPHVFEPFFSTKGKKGTGLGLASVYGIVQQSNGHVVLDSDVGRGTTFRVYLPMADETAAVDESAATKDGVTGTTSSPAS